jgi:hypothetical protein
MQMLWWLLSVLRATREKGTRSHHGINELVAGMQYRQAENK